MSPAEQPNNQTPEASEPGNKLNEPPKKRWDGPENITGKVTWPLRNITGQHELIHMVMRPDGNPDELAAAIQSLRADYGHVLTDEVIEEALRRKPNGRQEWMRKNAKRLTGQSAFPHRRAFK